MRCYRLVLQRLASCLGNSLQVRIEIALEVIELLGQVEDLRAIGLGHGEVLLKRIGIAAGPVGGRCPLEMRVAVRTYRDGVRLPGNSLTPIKVEDHRGLDGRSGFLLRRNRQDQQKYGEGKTQSHAEQRFYTILTDKLPRTLKSEFNLWLHVAAAACPRCASGKWRWPVRRPHRAAREARANRAGVRPSSALGTSPPCRIPPRLI